MVRYAELVGNSARTDKGDKVVKLMEHLLGFTAAAALVLALQITLRLALQ